jgi:hypothetical protein
MEPPIMLRWEEDGARMAFKAQPFFQLINIRQLKCGDKKRIKLRKSLGISQQDSEKIRGLAEAGLNAGIGKFGSELSAEMGVRVDLHFSQVEEEETLYEIGRCDVRSIEIYQRVIHVSLGWERARFFGFKRTGKIEFTVALNDFRDLGQAIPNHPDCGCGAGSKILLSKLLRIKVGDSISALDTAVWNFTEERLQKVKKSWDLVGFEGHSFDAEGHMLTPELRFFGGIRPDQRVKVLVEQQLDPAPFQTTSASVLDPIPILFPEMFDEFGSYRRAGSWSANQNQHAR